MTVLLYFTIVYCLIILILIIGLQKNYKSNHKNKTKQKISVIVAAKNEEKNIIRLLNALNTQNYPKDSYEVIIADDNSTDMTADIIKNYIKDKENFVYCYVSKDIFIDILGKKKALHSAINMSKYDILAFTDADCMPNSGWLSELNNGFTDNVDFISGYSPLIFKKNNTIAKLKNLERASIFAVCAGGFGLGIPLTCTARNMAYRKRVWNNSNGFNGINHILSGDDDLMLLKSRFFISKYKFLFNHNSIVDSYEENSVSKQVNQETRRASKFRYYPFYIKLLTLFISMYYLFLSYEILKIILTNYNYKSLIVNIGLKSIFEILLLTIFLIKVNRTYLMKYYFLASILYIPYFLFFGIKGTFSKYKWKN